MQLDCDLNKKHGLMSQTLDSVFSELPHNCVLCHFNDKSDKMLTGKRCVSAFGYFGCNLHPQPIEDVWPPQ